MVTMVLQAQRKAKALLNTPSDMYATSYNIFDFLSDLMDFRCLLSIICEIFYGGSSSANSCIIAMPLIP